MSINGTGLEYGSVHILTNRGGSPTEFTWGNGVWCGGGQTTYGTRPSAMKTLGWAYDRPKATKEHST